MKIFSELKPSINLFCRFTDEELENEYLSSDLRDSMKYMKPLVLILGMLDTLYLFFSDYTRVGEIGSLIPSIFGRAIFLVLIIILFLRLDRVDNPKMLYFWISICEALSFVLFLLSYSSRQSPFYLSQVLRMLLNILVIFLVPNRWLYMTAVALMGSIGFFTISALNKFTDSTTFTSSLFFTAIIIILSSISSFRANYYKRRQYLNNRELKKLSTTDMLTGLKNRVKLYEELQMWMNFSERYKTPLSLVLFDVDDFKKINDNYGHLAGDNVIVEISAMICDIIRETDILARWGGDEFIMLLPHTSRAQAIEITERIRRHICSCSLSLGHTVTCSFGVASMGRSVENIEHFIRRADNALYKAKNSGKNLVKY